MLPGKTDDNLDELIGEAPDWVIVGIRLNTYYLIQAAPLRASGAATRTYSLVILRSNSGAISAKEAPDYQKLPSRCPQRHMNSNGTFCLGFNAGANVYGKEAYIAWWNKLKVFLLCQETAGETGLWPNALQLSHGDAAETELFAEQVADELNLLNEYQDAVRYDTGLVARFVRRIDKQTGKLLNGRQNCVCGRQGRKRKTLLRRECWKSNFPCLPILENKRREQEVEFWASYAATPCCMTMRECPLR